MGMKIQRNFIYLIRRNFRAYKFSRICSARKLEIFARINFRAPLHFRILITCYMAIETKNRGQFCEKLTPKYFRGRNCENSVLISTNKVRRDLLWQKRIQMKETCARNRYLGQRSLFVFSMHSKYQG